MSTPKEIEVRVRHLIRDGQLQQAATICDQLNEQFPDYGSGWYTAGQLALLISEPALGVRAIDNALALSPDKPEWLLQRIECMGAMGDKAGAMELASDLVSHEFDDALLTSQLAYVFSKLGMFEEALPQYERTCRLQPDNSQHYYNLATALRFAGETDRAAKALDNCVRINPDDAEAHLMRAELRQVSAESNHVADLIAAHARSKDDANRRARLCYALAKELDDLGDYDRSFEFLLEGATLRRQRLNYDPVEDLKALATIEAVFGAEQFEQDRQGHINAEPIFVVGMQRSGTTLVERVLTSHSVVHPAGETTAFSAEFLQHCRRIAGPNVNSSNELVAKSLSIDFVALGEDYIRARRGVAGKKAHFVDNLPLNVLYAGMIHLALPKAKIVLLRRDPMDTCYAIFKTLFERVYPFSCNLVELANYFVACDRLMDHWLQAMPNVIHVVRYEDLLREPRPVIEDLLDYCNLSYEDDCVRFYDAKAPAPSASATQVRRAFSRASIGNWRNYERQLQPVAEILASAGLLPYRDRDNQRG
ncbi:MAG: sulfotransferase [Gammaproteobacteria bacterium]|nr:sulfotransferase [Gammaproteobacteria bacterium]